MKTALFALAALLLPQAQAPETENYTDPQLGLSFSHPKTWVLLKAVAPKPDRKGRRGKPDTQTVHFRVPIAGSTDDADLMIFRASFNGSPETWQQIQVTANQNLKREVQRQWQQEVLGVPMLLTRINYSEDGVSRTAVTGLLYNDWPYKLQFRLTGPSSTFDQAQYEFTEALETLRTTDNNLPKPQEPDKAPTKAASEVRDLRGQKSVISDGSDVKVKLEKAPVVVPQTIANHKVELRLPLGWTATPGQNGDLLLNTSKLSNPLHVSLSYMVDSDPPETALLKASGATLADFDKVDLREDPPGLPNRAGAQVATVWRRGTNAKGTLATVEAVGVSGDYYFVLTGRPATGPKYQEDRKLIESLLSQLSVEPAP